MGIRARAMGIGLVVAASFASVFFGAEATAKTQYDSRYGYEKTWNAAVRLVRVDLGLKVLEKDESSGYLLFEYRSNEGGPKATSGSFEIIKPSGSKTDDVKVVVQLPQMPRYHEQVLVDQLARKMHDEYGEPPPRKKDAPPPPPDAGADAGEDDEPNSGGSSN